MVEGFLHYLRYERNYAELTVTGYGKDLEDFQEYFQSLEHTPTRQGQKRNVTIITYDEQSAMQIKDNFRANGIDVRSLFNKVRLEFIMTKAIYEENRAEVEKLNKLLDNML